MAKSLASTGLSIGLAVRSKSGKVSYPIHLNGKLIGNINEIRQVQGGPGFAYQPKGSSTTGEVFKSLRDCYRSLED